MPADVSNGVLSSERHAQFPEFEAGALKVLTNKIEQNLRKGTVKPVTSLETEPKAVAIKDERERYGNAQRSAREEQYQRSSSNIRDNAKPHAAFEHLRPDQSIGRPKRLRNGNTKGVPSSQAHPKKSRGSSALEKTGHTAVASLQTDLREEIQALGGSNDDYELVAAVQSDSEYEEPAQKIVGGDLAKDVKNFATSLGIEAVREYASVESSDDQAVEEESRDAGPLKKSAATALGVFGTSKSDTVVETPRQVLKVQRQLFLQPLSEWHAAELAPLPESTEGQKAAPTDLIERVYMYAKALLKSENQAFADTQTSASSSHKFYSTIMASGTLSDKIGALTLSVQASPIHNMKSLENLIGLGRKRSRTQAVEVLGALKDLFGPGNLLPSHRKLHSFATNPQLHTALKAGNISWREGKPLLRPLTEAHLIFWAYEDWLKSAFFQTLQILETWSNDEVTFARGRAVDYVSSMLKEKPEQEANLLRLLVNKLGDRDKKVASKTSYHVLQLETTHPAMKPTIISAIESDVLFRPHQSLHAKYYAIITLNQTVLSNREESLAKKLIDVYFTMFLKLLQKPKKGDETLPSKAASQAVQLNSKGEVQGGGSAPGKAALKKKASQEKSAIADDDLREKIVAAVLTGVNRAIPYISTNDESFEKHLDTLFRVTHSSNFNTSIQALMLIQQIQGSRQTTADRFYRTLYEALLDPRLLTSSKQVLFLNLLYRALRSDLNIDRIKAFAKRITQVIAMHQPSFTCGAIYLLRELESVFPSLQPFVDQPEESFSDDEETFRDVPEDPPTTHCQPSPAYKQSRKDYDAHKRDPLHSNASASTLWDIHPLTNHYHPSVSLFATRLLAHAGMPPKPDLNLNTLIHFLDRFVYKNPKSSGTQTGPLKGHSLMQPLAAGESKGAVLVSNAKSGNTRVTNVPVNTEEFWKLERSKVGADEMFFHKYFSEVEKRKDRMKGRREKMKKKKMTKLADGVEGSDGEEEEIWKALVESKPEIEGKGDDDEEGFEESELHGYDDSEASAEASFVLEEDEEEEGFPDFSDGESDALVDSDDELPDDKVLDAAFVDEADMVGRGEKVEKRSGKKGASKEKRRRLKNLPTFASADEYEKVLGGDDEEGIA